MDPISEAGVSTSLHKLIARSAIEAGFDGITNSALAEIEGQALAFMSSLIFLSRSIAWQSRRTKGNPLDFVTACEMGGLSVAELHDFLRHLRNSPVRVPMYINAVQDLPLMEEEMPLVLPQDAAEAEMELNDRLPIQPDFFPPLPPKHSWRQTPVYPENSTFSQQQKESAASAKSIHDDRVRTTRLVEASLRNLIQASNEAASRIAAPKTSAQATTNGEQGDQDMDELPPPLDLDVPPVTTNDTPAEQSQEKEKENKGKEKEQEKRVEFPMLVDIGNTAACGADAMQVNWEVSGGKKRGLAAVRDEQMLGLVTKQKKRMKWVF